MPSSAEHQAKALANRVFLDSGLAAVSSEWAAVVAFYAAVHLVERLAAAEPRGPVHHRTHVARVAWLARHRPHRTIFNDYAALQDAAEVSRYGTVNQFRSMYTAAAVQSQLIDTHLAAIERYVTTHFAPPPPAAPTGT